MARSNGSFSLLPAPSATPRWPDLGATNAPSNEVNHGVADLGAVLRAVTSALAASLPPTLRIVTEARRMTLVRSEEASIASLLEAVSTRLACRASGTEEEPAELLIAAMSQADAVRLTVRVAPVAVDSTDPLSPELRAMAAAQGVPMRAQFGDGALEVVLSVARLVQPTSVARSGTRPRVAVIDDEELVGRSIERILHGTFEVQRFSHAREALDAMAAGQRFALILCDLMMPEMTGMAFHDALASVAPELSPRCCWMTGGAFTPTSIAFLKGREAATIEKPFMPAALRAWVSARIERVSSELR